MGKGDVGADAGVGRVCRVLEESGSPMSGEGAVERFGEGLFAVRNVGAEDVLGVVF